MAVFFDTNDHANIWSVAQAQIERVSGSLVTVVGELQAIAQEQLPQLDSMMQLETIGNETLTEDA